MANQLEVSKLFHRCDKKMWKCLCGVEVHNMTTSYVTNFNFVKKISKVLNYTDKPFKARKSESQILFSVRDVMMENDEPISQLEHQQKVGSVGIVRSYRRL